MKLYKSRRAFLIQQKIADVIRDRLRRRQRIERRKGANAKVFTRSAVAWRTRWNQTQQRFGKRQVFRLQSIKHRVQRALLLIRRDDLRIAIAFAAQAEGVVFAAD